MRIVSASPIRGAGVPTSRRTGRGFSLSEMVISILILSILSVILVGVIPSAMFGMKSAENRAQAAGIARDVIETMRVRDFATLASTTEDAKTSNGTEYHVSVDVGPAVVEGVTWNEETARDVRVTVMWKDRTGWKRREDVQTYTARTILFNN